ncbi:hypothetical protein K431DRAFT_44340 [Polychaeton citri CBS 116435]|uniref:Uncharacterized protein n=1 Tax=Polychaeton citri CBS 116435 TaxID=1314669 RepID=A0A9P4Q8A3_9PEZI|nr:hypothetical protein K431DRAFT_44340 [Polychaeton citri CBS 116435]
MASLEGYFNRFQDRPTMLASELLLLVGERQHDGGSYRASRFCDSVLSQAFPSIPGTFFRFGQYRITLQDVSRAGPICELNRESSRFLNTVVHAILGVTSDPDFAELITVRGLSLKNMRFFAFCKHHLLSTRDHGSSGNEPERPIKQQHHGRCGNPSVTKDQERAILTLEFALRRDKRFEALADCSASLYPNSERIPFPLLLLMNDYAQIITPRQPKASEKLSVISRSFSSTYRQLLEFLSGDLSVIAAIANSKYERDIQAEQKWQMS